MTDLFATALISVASCKHPKLRFVGIVDGGAGGKAQRHTCEDCGGVFTSWEGGTYWGRGVRDNHFNNDVKMVGPPSQEPRQRGWKRLIGWSK